MRKSSITVVETLPPRGEQENVPNIATDTPSTMSHRGCLPTNHTTKRMLNQEIGLLMLVLAAQTITGMVNIQDNALSTELVADSHNFHGRPSLKNENPFSSSHYSSASSDKHVPFVDLSEGISSSTVDSDVSESFDDDGDDEEMTSARLAFELTTPRRNRSNFQHSEDIWENIFNFLPWEAALQVRGVSRFHFHQALPHVTVARMPLSGTPAIFIPCLEDLDSDELKVEEDLAPQETGAQPCLQCGAFPGQRCACGPHGVQRLSSNNGQRLFLGQLRRAGTVPMVRWLVNYVFNAPAGALVSVENRRNAQTQRGKGCAWPTINDGTTVKRMLSAHHRMFFDNVNGVEGIWLVPKGQESALQSEVSMRYDSGVHQKHMPRGTMVVETPSSPFAVVPSAVPRQSTSGKKESTSKMLHGGATQPSDWSSYASAIGPTCSGLSLQQTHRGSLPLYSASCAMHTSRVGMATSKQNGCEEALEFTPFCVPGVDFVRLGVYRLNPYTVQVLQ